MTGAGRCSVWNSVAVMGLVCILAAGGVFAEKGVTDNSSALAQAEAMLDAFYAWDAAALLAAVEPSADADRLLYYQGWAEAAHYTIALREPCRRLDAGAIECRVMVHDDFGQALGYIATDTFRLTPGPTRIASVTFSGDDPPIFQELLTWISQRRPEVMGGACKDLFNGGTTPADCARAVAESARLFMKTRGSTAQDP